MSESEAHLDKLQRRILSALDRIGQGVDGLEPPAPAGQALSAAEAEALQQALDDERTANAQLEERIRALRQRQDEIAANADKAMADQRAALSRMDQDLQRMQAANAQLRENNQALRAANEAGVGEPHLINKAMLAELEALRAARAADRSEADAIVAALAPMIVNGADTGSQKGDA